MRLGVVADIHGNLEALRAVLDDAAPLGVERWWALGDLVLFGPRPVEVLETLAALPGIAYVSGNTDRYVCTAEQPHPHQTAADVVGSLELIERYTAMAAAIGWTRGALVHAGWFDAITALPAEQREVLPDGSTLLGVHASPESDAGPGIDNRSDDADLARLLGGCGADTVVGGHTHDPTDRAVGPVRALNAGSVGVPRHCGHASWLLLHADGDGIRPELREARFDVDAVVRDLHARGYPNAAFMASVLTGEHPMG